MRKLLLVVPLLLAACGTGAPTPAATGLPTTSSTTTTLPVLLRTDPPPGVTWPNGHVAGHWVQQWPAPDGQTVLGFWSGECESPSAWFGDQGAWRPVVTAADGGAAETYAYGWTDDGRARVYATEGICGTGIDRPGTYLVTPEGVATFESPDQPR